VDVDVDVEVKVEVEEEEWWLFASAWPPPPVADAWRDRFLACVADPKAGVELAEARAFGTGSVPELEPVAIDTAASGCWGGIGRRARA
jgi:hypothetical protein